MSEQSIVQATETAMVRRIESARWLADLKPQDRQSLAHLAVKYGLDPLMKELTIYEGSPYIAIAGLIRIAHRQKMFAGLEDRPMTAAERTQYGYKAPFCWLVHVYRKDWKCPATGTGTADPSNPFRNNPIERSRPEWMARSRAIRQALKLSFPHSLPFEEIESAEERGIDFETGEIIEAEAIEVGGQAETTADEAPSDLPADLTATATPEPQDEQDAIEDMHRKVEELRQRVGSTDELLDRWCQKHLNCTLAEAGLDGLIALRDKLADAAAKKGGA